MKALKMNDEQKMRSLGAICWAVYFVSYITRINYGAVISEIAAAEGILKSSAGLVATCSFVSYGAGQITSGIMGDKFKPEKLIFFGLAATSLINLSMPFCFSVAVMAAMWFFNGLAQSFMWPPLVKIMSVYMDGNTFKKACVNVSLAGSAGTVAVYLAAPSIITHFGWRGVFYICGALGAAMSGIWALGVFCLNLKGTTTVKTAENAENGQKLNFKTIASSGIAFIAVGIIAQGLLRDGITTWMPSFVAETFGTGNAAAIFTAVILPVFGIISIKAAAFIHSKLLKDEIACAAALFAAGFVFCTAIGFLYKTGMVFSVVSAALITGCMHGVNLMLICMTPDKFKKYGMVSTASGLLNSLTYIGSAASSYGFARLCERFGWQFTLFSWAAVALCGTICCFLAVKRWKRFKEL